MPSGKKSREQRRTAAAKTPPPVRSKGATRARQASPRALAIGGGVVAIVVVAVVLALVLGGGGGGGGIPKNHVAVGSLSNGLPGASDVAAEFKGIPQVGTTLGWPFAPVTMTEYIDLQCPICQEFETQVFPDIVQRYVRTKKVKVVMKPWAFIGPDSFRGQKVALAAAKQNKVFNFAAVLYDNQGTENTGWMTDQMLYNIAASVPGLKIDPLFAERNTGAVKSEASQVAADAQAQKVSGTPTIFLTKGAGKPVQVPMANGLDETTLVTYLNRALA
ncbi:MAG TPA: thioredoxin domain-containing protein [Gaiellaceae bacterium]|nr:thioredoxin domain-containing protein [Gaiellaceae bacterium]